MRREAVPLLPAVRNEPANPSHVFVVMEEQRKFRGAYYLQTAFPNGHEELDSVKVRGVFSKQEAANKCVKELSENRFSKMDEDTQVEDISESRLKRFLLQDPSEEVTVDISVRKHRLK